MVKTVTHQLEMFDGSENVIQTYGCRSLTFFCALLGLLSSSELFTLDLVLADFFSFCLVSPGGTQTRTVCARVISKDTFRTGRKNVPGVLMTHTLLSHTGGGVIVRALNLLFLQVRLKSRQVCVETSDVFVDLRGNGEGAQSAALT